MDATCSSPWTAASAPSVRVQLLPDHRGGVAVLDPLALQLSRPEGSSAACELSLQWKQQPLRCLQLKLEAKCSARHVELYATGQRRTMLGEHQQDEVYLGTFRGVREGAMAPSTQPQTFVMSAGFAQSDKDCDVLQSLEKLRVKFVSLTGDKSVLTVHELRCIFVPMQPEADSVAKMAEKLSGVSLGAAGAAPDVQMILKGFQQTLEREMETKIARAVDAKLATLSQRLAFSEQALFQLHKKMIAKDANVQANLDKIQQKFSQLEAQLNQFTVAHGADDKEVGEIDGQAESGVDEDPSDQTEAQETSSETEVGANAIETE